MTRASITERELGTPNTSSSSHSGVSKSSFAIAPSLAIPSRDSPPPVGRDGAPPFVHKVLRAPEPRLGHDFSRVHVHTGERATEIRGLPPGGPERPDLDFVTSPAVGTAVRWRGGQPLPPTTRAAMEYALEHDLSQIRLHTGSDAAAAARAVNAKAFTLGQDIFFGEGRYQPGTREGDKLLAHELTHTVQQRGDPGIQADSDDRFTVSHPGDPQEQEAEHIAEAVMAGRTGGTFPVGFPSSAADGRRLQRDVHLPEQPTRKTARAEFSGDWFYYLVKDEIEWRLNPIGTFDLVLLLEASVAKRLAPKRIGETAVAVLTDSMGVPFRNGPQALADQVSADLEAMGWPPAFTEQVVAYRIPFEIPTIRQQFEEKAFNAWWAQLKQELGGGIYAGSLIAAGNFATGKSARKSPGKAQAAVTGSEPEQPRWVREQLEAVTRLLEDAKRQDLPSKNLPDHLVTWYNERDQGWYVNVWVYFDPVGSKKAAWPVQLHPGETPEQTLVRVRAATEKALLRGEDRARQQAAQTAPEWARRIERELRGRLDQLRQVEKNATDFPDGMALVSGADIGLQVWVERGKTKIERNYGSVPLMPQSTVDQLVPYVRHLAALLRQFESKPEGFEVTTAGTDESALAAFPAEIRPMDLREDRISVTGANNEFHMKLDYEAVYGGGPLKDLYIASKLYSQAIRFFWKIYRVAAANVPLPEGAKHAPEAWDTRWQWLYDSYNKAPRDERGKPQVPEPGALLYETSGSDSSSRVRFPDEPGDYLVRCTTGHAPIGEHQLKRVSSDAWFPVRVKPIKEVAEAAVSLRPAAIRALEAELKSVEALLSGGKIDAHQKQLLLAQQQVKKGDLDRLRAKETQTVAQNTSAEIAYATGMLAKVKELNRILPEIVQQAKSQGVAPSELLSDRPELLTVYWYIIAEGKTPASYQQELEGQILQLGKVRKRAAEFSNELKSTSPYQYAPEVALVSKVTGHVYPLTMMLGEAPESADVVVYSLIDITSSQTQKTYRGYSMETGREGHIEAINRAFEDFGEDATYGEGIIAVRIPAGAAGRSSENHPGTQIRYYQSKEGILQKVLWALGIIAAVAGTAALVATGVGAPAAAGILGAVAAVAGAVTSIHALSERASRHTLEWDAETALDIIGIIAVVPAVAGARQVVGLRTVIVTERFFQIYAWTETGATVILVPTKLAQDIDRIHKLQEEGELTADQAETMIAQARLGAAQAGLMMLGSAAAARAGAHQSRGSQYEQEHVLRQQIELLELEGFGEYKSMAERGWIDEHGNFTDKAPEIVRPKAKPPEAPEGKPPTRAQEERPAPEPVKEPTAPATEEKPPAKGETEEKPALPEAEKQRPERAKPEREQPPVEEPKAAAPKPKAKSKKQLRKEALTAEREARVRAEIEAHEKAYSESKARQEALKEEIAAAQRRYEETDAELANLARQLKEAEAARERGEDPGVDTRALRAQHEELLDVRALHRMDKSRAKAKLDAEIRAGQGVTPELYKRLRRATPSDKARDEILDRAQGVDEVFGTKETEANPLEPDHIVPVTEITKMDGFNRLPWEKQVEILNLKENLIAMNKSANSSKQGKSWEKWEGWKQFTKDPAIRKRMIEKEADLRVRLQNEINKGIPR